jgi:hypothetical protein
LKILIKKPEERQGTWKKQYNNHEKSDELKVLRE